MAYYCARAHSFGRERCYTQHEQFDKALFLAKKKDELREKLLAEGKDLESELPLLHGLPFSVKDHLMLRDAPCSNGMGSMSDIHVPRDANCVTLYREGGGIPFVKGNMPEMALSMHVTNDIWGTAQNPWNHERTCGGSSGGDAAMVASGITPFCFGTDIGGSIRLPAAFVGVPAIFPSRYRCTNRDVLPYSQKLN